MPTRWLRARVARLTFRPSRFRREHRFIIDAIGDQIVEIEYGVATLLGNRALASRVGAIVCCAPDQVGAWGAVEVLRSNFDLRPTVISGPATDNVVGRDIIRDRLGVAAINAMTDSAELGDLVANMIGAGMFLTPGLVAGHLPGVGWQLVAWVAGAVLALSGAAIYGELGARLPRAGGDYQYLAVGFGPLWGFLTGWAAMLLTFSAAAAKISRSTCLRPF